MAETPQVVLDAMAITDADPVLNAVKMLVVCGVEELDDNDPRAIAYATTIVAARTPKTTFTDAELGQLERRAADVRTLRNAMRDAREQHARATLHDAEEARNAVDKAARELAALRIADLRAQLAEAEANGIAAGMEQAARMCEGRATEREGTAETMHREGQYTDAARYLSYATAERCCGSMIRTAATAHLTRSPT